MKNNELERKKAKDEAHDNDTKTQEIRNNQTT